MKYYPNSNNTNIKIYYTNGNEYMFSDTSKYIGNYHIINDILFEGTSHTSKSKRLYKLNNDYLFKEYINIVGINSYNQYTTPVNIIPIISNDDYDKGVFDRYFIKRRNNIKSTIFEVNKLQYDDLTVTNKGIDFKLYFGIKLQWKLIGSIYDVKDGNKTIESGIYDSNQRTVILYNNQMNGLNEYLINFLQYANII